MRLRNKILTGFGMFLGLGLFLFCWFYLEILGPPDFWKNGPRGYGITIRTPNAPPDELQPYIQEFKNKGLQRVEEKQISDPKIKGEVWSYKVGGDVETAQTHTGNLWGSGQHLYWRDSGGMWKEVTIPPDLTIQTYGIMKYRGLVTAIVEDWNPWSSFGFFRLIHSIFDKKLRYENGVYLVDVRTGEFVYQFPGGKGILSPDGTKLFFIRSRGAHDEHHELIVWNFKSGTLQTITELTEADPGLGMSFRCAWSDDSNVINIAGSADKLMFFQLLYLTDKGELVRIY